MFYVLRLRIIGKRINMKSPEFKHSRWVGAAALFAVLFGLLTIKASGGVLFNAEAQRLAGNYVEFVVWFNFLAGFAYILAGVGLWYLQRWSVWLSFLIAATTLIVFAAFGIHILTGGSYEMRTIAAMSLRTVVWFIISAVAYQNLNRP
jgi:hypothetical protein